MTRALAGPRPHANNRRPGSSLAFWLSIGLPARRDKASALSSAELKLSPYGGSTLGPLFHGLQRRRRHTVLKLAFQKPYLWYASRP
jgi:hypothetical protein